MSQEFLGIYKQIWEAKFTEKDAELELFQTKINL